MNTLTKILVLAIVVTLGHLGNAPSAVAITISIAEVRGDAAYVKGSDAGRKQQINWEGVDVTKANGKGNFSFEGALPNLCVVGDCDGILIAGGDPIEVSLDLPSDPPGEPPSEPIDELTREHLEEDSHDGDSVRAVGFVEGVTDVQVVSGGADTHLRYWDLDLQPTVDLVLPNIIYDIDVLTDDVIGTSIVATGEGGWNGHAGSETLRIFNASGDELTKTQVPIGFVYSVAFSPWGLMAASGFYGDQVMYQTSDLELYDITATRKKRTQALAFSTDGSLVASASTGGIQLRSVPLDCGPGNCQLELKETLSHSGSWSFSIAFLPGSILDRIEMVSGTDSGKTKFWIIEKNLDTDELTVLSVQSFDTGSVHALASSPNGDMIVAGGGNGDITVYDSTDLADPKIIFRNSAVDAHSGRVNDVAFSPDSSLDSFRIVSGGADGALKLWKSPPTP
jgi:WD40 repeat protein